MGADRAVHVKCGSEDIADLGPLAVSNIIAKVAQQEKIDLVMLGKQVRGRGCGGGLGIESAVLSLD